MQSSTEKTPGFKSLQEIYEVTKYQNDLTLFFFFFLFVNCEPISFEEAIQEQRQKNVMDGEIKAIRKSYIWELNPLSKEKKKIRVRRVYKGKKMWKEDWDTKHNCWLRCQMCSQNVLGLVGVC